MGRQTFGWVLLRNDGTLRPAAFDRSSSRHTDAHRSCRVRGGPQTRDRGSSHRDRRRRSWLEAAIRDVKGHLLVVYGETGLAAKALAPGDAWQSYPDDPFVVAKRHAASPNPAARDRAPLRAAAAIPVVTRIEHVLPAPCFDGFISSSLFLLAVVVAVTGALAACTETAPAARAADDAGGPRSRRRKGDGQHLAPERDDRRLRHCESIASSFATATSVAAAWWRPMPRSALHGGTVSVTSEGRGLGPTFDDSRSRRSLTVSMSESEPWQDAPGLAIFRTLSHALRSLELGSGDCPSTRGPERLDLSRARARRKVRNPRREPLAGAFPFNAP